jgi:C-5 cytosine-specific DNA methylase
MVHGSLFSGIGGFDLAAEWMGWENRFHCEWNEFGRKVLNHYWPEAHSINDIHNLTVDNYGNIIHLKDKDVITMGQKKSSKYDNAVSLYESGMSIADCASFYEISRQAMHKILDRRGCVFRDNLRYGEDNHFYRGCMPNRSKKERVHNLVETALSNGVISNPGVCECCGGSGVFKDGRSAIQAHHYDYDKPLDVEWLCQKCHHEWHKNNKAINETDTEKLNEPSGAIDILSGGFP